MVELLIVVVLLGTLASAAVYAVGESTKSAARDTTLATLAAARDAAIGSGPAHLFCFRRDVGRAPARIAELLQRPALVAAYDPATGFGWRGPYVMAPTAMYDAELASFGTRYGVEGEPALRDGWGTQIVLQIPDDDGAGITDEDRRYARLVSAGEDRLVQTPPLAWYPSRASCGDDLVLYLQVPDLRPNL